MLLLYQKKLESLQYKYKQYRSMSTGGKWDEHVALNIDIPLQCNTIFQEVSKGQRNSESHLTAIQNIKDIFGDQIIMTKISTYKTPISQGQFTSLIFHHEYAIIETQSTNKNLYWSAEKNRERIWLSVYNSFQRCRDYCPTFIGSSSQRRYKATYWKPQLKKKVIKPTNQNFFSLLEWIFEEDKHKEKYHYLKSNCQVFCDHLYNKFKP